MSKKRLTKAQLELKKKLIQRIHISDKYKSFYKDNREDYETKLLEHFGVKSSKDMHIEQLFALLRWLNYEVPELETIKDRSNEVTARQLTAMREMWELYAKHKDEEALRNFIYRITKNRYLHLNSITKSDATKCITALKKTLKAR